MRPSFLWIVVLLLFKIAKCNTVSEENDSNTTSVAQGLCRSKIAALPPDDFYLNSCAWCYFFLYRSKGLFPADLHYLEVLYNTSKFPSGTKLLADVKNNTARENICSTLSNEECELWTLCCNSARHCCQRQIEEPVDDVSNTSCLSTWDGIECWEGGTPGNKYYKPCSTFLQFSVPTTSV